MAEAALKKAASSAPHAYTRCLHLKVDDHPSTLLLLRRLYMINAVASPPCTECLVGPGKMELRDGWLPPDMPWIIVTTKMALQGKALVGLDRYHEAQTSF